MQRGSRRIDAAQVRAYYESNTSRFLSMGAGGRFGVIHREVWAEGVSDARQAFHYVNELVARLLAMVAHNVPEGARLRVLDMGSGVGASLFYLLERFPERELECFGISISDVQTQMACQRAKAEGFAEACRFVTGDFEEEPLPIGCDLVFFIESFIHAQRPWSVLEKAASALRPGGVLVICDDFLNRTLFTPRDKMVLSDFRDGWKAAHRTTVSELARQATARRLRLIEDKDLTPFLNLGRPRDRLIAACVNTLGPLLPPSPWRDSLLGGHAVQEGLRSGLLCYRFLAFRRD